MFTSTHYTGLDLNVQYRNGEPWKKVFGPAFVYLNQVSPGDDTHALWEDAKEQVYSLQVLQLMDNGVHVCF